jgi:hypothetical protein
VASKHVLSTYRRAKGERGENQKSELKGIWILLIIK